MRVKFLQLLLLIGSAFCVAAAVEDYSFNGYEETTEEEVPLQRSKRQASAMFTIGTSTLNPPKI